MSWEDTYNELSFEEKQQLTAFLEEVLFFESGVYTLFGTKPVTEILLNPNDSSTEEMYEYIRSLSKNTEVYLHENHLLKDWKVWESFSKELPIKNFLIFKKTFISPHVSQTAGLESIVILNIPQTIFTLKRYYQDFVKIVGYDFDPQKIVLEINKKDSNFWNQIFTHHALAGILFGFGQINSWLFHWKQLAATAENKDSYLNKIVLKSSIEKYVPYPTKSSFSIPQFVYIDSRSVEKYKDERKHIQKILKEEDLLKITMDKLTN